MNDKKPIEDVAVDSSTIYRATTGLENAHGERVEQGEILPRDFVPPAQLAIWLQNRDVLAVFSEGHISAEDNAREDESA